MVQFWFSFGSVSVQCWFSVGYVLVQFSFLVLAQLVQSLLSWFNFGVNSGSVGVESVAVGVDLYMAELRSGWNQRVGRAPLPSGVRLHARARARAWSRDVSGCSGRARVRVHAHTTRARAHEPHRHARAAP